MPHYDLEKGTARENLCRFLAACYYQPGPEFSEEKVFGSMLDAATRIHSDLAAHARRLGEEFSAEEPESLLVDYTRLFLGRNVIGHFAEILVHLESALVVELLDRHRRVPHEGVLAVQPD